MKVYISGPVSGYPDNNAEAFNRAEDALRREGYEPLNPLSIKLGENATWEDYLRADLRLLTTADAIYLLKDWGESKGARLEAYVARKLNMTIMEEGE